MRYGLRKGSRIARRVLPCGGEATRHWCSRGPTPLEYACVEPLGAAAWLRRYSPCETLHLRLLLPAPSCLRHRVNPGLPPSRLLVRSWLACCAGSAGDCDRDSAECGQRVFPATVTGQRTLWTGLLAEGVAVVSVLTLLSRRPDGRQSRPSSWGKSRSL